MFSQISLRPQISIIPRAASFKKFKSEDEIFVLKNAKKQTGEVIIIREFFQ
jgi:hypothetical protein